MVQKFIFGTPFETEAIVSQTGIVTKDGKKALEDGSFPYFMIRMDETGKEVLSFSLKEEDIVFGLGENVRGMNKRGWHYVSNCSDDPVHGEDKVSLYGAHNFLLIKGERNLGIFIDYPGKLLFDVGYTHYDELVISLEEWNFAIYLIEEDSLENIAKRFREMIGRSYIAPKWAFGYGQSRWSYMNEEEIREVVRKHRENHIPLDSVYMDIDYMERYKDFTINEEAFPNFEAFVQEMKEQGIHLIPIIDAGVKIEEGYDVYEEGLEKGYFCKDQNGKEFVVGVWPGRVHLPDMLNKDARKWFGQKYDFLLKKGIDGFWNDMNEPALFYSEEHLEEVLKEVSAMQGQNLDLDKFFHLKDLVLTLSNNEEDYKKFYHVIDGKKYRHDKVHNLYGYAMTRAAGEAFEELEKEKRILMFSRSSYVGMHRYGGIWTGDNMANFSHLLLYIQMMPAVQMCGFLYTGADLGGFGSNTSEELLMRFLEFGMFTPLMRNHAAMGTRRQEAYAFDRTERFAALIGIRYALLPYLYSEYMKAVIGNTAYFAPLAFAYPQDMRASRVEDQLMLGKELMLAPVYTQNATGRYVYLPEDMKLVRMRSAEEIETEMLKKGDHYVSCKVDEVIFFVRPGRMIPLAKAADCVEKLNEKELTWLIYEDDACSYDLYSDDGYEKTYEDTAHLKHVKYSQGGIYGI